MQKRHFFSSRTLLTAVLAITAGMVAFHVPGTPARAQQGSNLLQNPGFEPPYIAINNDSTLQVASGWQPWSMPPGASSAENKRPEYVPAPSNRIHSGSAAQEFNTFFATHTAGVFQRVPVTSGTPLRFSIYVYVWSSASFANPDVSEDPNHVLVRVGIDPTGGTDPSSSQIVWSTDAEYYDQYRELSVTTTSQGTAVTVFVRSAAQGYVGTNNVYLDDAALMTLGSAPATTAAPLATPTSNALIPTQEGAGVLVPTTPAQPTAIPTTALPSEFNSTITYTVQAGDTVLAIAQRYGSTVEAIGKVNGLSNVGLIFVGQTLVIPVRSQVQPPPTFTPAPIPSISVTSGSSAPAPGTYSVRGGDTLFSIALRFNTTAATLAQINNLVNPNLIYPGQVLQVPGTGGTGVVPTTAPAAPTQVPPAQPSPTTHVVQAGENLFRISLRYNVTVDALARANGLSNVNLLFPGQVLVIPR